jgi:very-short-patch-repair endonuclease
MRSPKIAAARTMRKAPTFTESLLWTLLRNRKLSDLKFRRQVPMGPYVADFLCFSHKLIVEADGYWHDEERDAVRDAWLKETGFTVLRFANEDIQKRPDDVLATIIAASKGVRIQAEDQDD